MKDFKWSGSSGPLLIAEIGGNHEGNFEYALKLTELAIASGVDYVKFQIYTGDGLVNPLESPDRNQHFKKFELSQEQHLTLAEMCKQAGVGYTASIWESEPLNWLKPYLDFVKIGSGDLTAFSMIQETTKTGLPILLSTGLATELEILETIKFIESCSDNYKNREMIAVLQCTSMYPIPNHDANLSVMNRIENLTSRPVGYSDHTEGTDALLTAATMGAQVLEFHFTDSREGKAFRDHKVSLTKGEVQQLKVDLEALKILKGNPIKTPLEVEGDHVTSFRRAIYPAKELQKGTIINQSDLVSLRPNHGIPANEIQNVIGKRSNKKLKKFEKLDWKYFDEVD